MSVFQIYLKEGMDIFSYNTILYESNVGNAVGLRVLWHLPQMGEHLKQTEAALRPATAGLLKNCWQGTPESVSN